VTIAATAIIRQHPKPHARTADFPKIAKRDKDRLRSGIVPKARLLRGGQESPRDSSPVPRLDARRKFFSRKREAAASPSPILPVFLPSSPLRGLKQLSRLTQLHSVFLGGTAITDASISNLARLQQLERLWVYPTQITDQGSDRLHTLMPGTVVLSNGEVE
jgi:hypothetical protein